MPQPPQPPASLLAVFGTTELLETILLCLPIHDLLVSKRDQTRFRDVMKGSSKIKQALWFEPKYEISDAEIAIMKAYVPGVQQTLRSTSNSSIKHYVHFLPDGLATDVLLNPFFETWIRQDGCRHFIDGNWYLFEHGRLRIKNYRALGHSGSHIMRCIVAVNAIAPAARNFSNFVRSRRPVE